jgi:hypothetical protein
MSSNKHLKCLIKIWALVAAVLVEAAGEVTVKGAINYKKLPNNVDPYDYFINLHLLDGFYKVEGKVGISLKISDKILAPRTSPSTVIYDESNQIVLNADRRLEISHAALVTAKSVDKLRRQKGERQSIRRIVRDNDRQMVAIQFEKKLPAGHYGRLTLVYKSSAPVGNNGDKRHWLPGHTRQLFPCFDDPAFKSKLRINITHDQSDINEAVVSNLPRVSDRLMLHVKTGSSGTRTRFVQPTPASIDKLSFKIGPFHQVQASSATNIDHIFPILMPRPDDLESNLAKAMAKKSFEWLKVYFNTTNSMDGGGYFADKIARMIPKANNGESNVAVSFAVALKQARDWFEAQPCAESSFWIKEALAAYYAIRIVRELKPELEVERFVRSQLLALALSLDTSGLLAPVASTGVPSEDIGLPFSLLQLMKGASIMQMIEHDIVKGRGTFDKIIRPLLINNDKLDEARLARAFANDQFTQEQIMDFLHVWSKRKGYPYIAVSVDRESRSVELDQVPIFWLNGLGIDNHAEDFQAWPLALQVKFSGDNRIEVREVAMNNFGKQKSTIRVKMPDWFGRSGADFKHNLWLGLGLLPFYRVGYSKDPYLN